MSTILVVDDMAIFREPIAASWRRLKWTSDRAGDAERKHLSRPTAPSQSRF